MSTTLRSEESSVPAERHTPPLRAVPMIRNPEQLDSSLKERQILQDFIMRFAQHHRH